MFSFLFLLLSLHGWSQDYEIRAVSLGNGVIGVEMRTTGAPVTTSNYVTDIVFGLRWQSSYNVDLANAVTTAYNIKKAGARGLKNGYHFQAFYADNVPLSLPSTWQQNAWVEMARIANTQGGAGTGNFEICATGFDPTTDPNLGIDLVDRTPLINGSATMVALPVVWLRFEATAREKEIRLSWQTASERDNKGFVVQRSKDGTTFDSIGWVAGRGTTAAVFDYAFTDAGAEMNVLYQYRLKQQDANNRAVFSEVRSARMVADDKEAFRLSPNPAKAVLAILYSGSAVNGKAKIKVIDGKGAVVIEAERPILAGATINLDLSSIQNGQYYLTVEQNKEVLFKKAFQKME